MKYLTLFSAVFFLFACSSKHAAKEQAAVEYSEADAKQEIQMPTGAAAPLADDAAASYGSVAPAEGTASADAAIPVEQKVIRTAVIKFSVNDFDSVKSRIAGVVNKAGGYIANETQTTSNIEKRNQLEIKVPKAAFDKCVDSLTIGVSRLDEKSINSQDITAEYVDIDARMKARAATEQRYLELLKQARNVKEMLEVEIQLKAIREEVEAAKGKLKYFDNHVSYSTITLEYYQTFGYTAPQSPGFFQRAWFSVKEGWNSLLGAGLGLLSLWPFVIGICFIFIFMRRVIKRRRAKRLAVSPVTNVNQ